MKKQVAKSLVFTKETLTTMQDKMRACCIKSFNRVYHENYHLKIKETGRNQDISVSNMKNYLKLKKQQEQNKQRLANANKKTDLLSEKTNSIEKLLEDLKPTTFKNNFVFSAGGLNTLKEYIADVKTVTETIKGVNDLDVIITEYGKDLREHENQIWDLKEQIEQKDTAISEMATELKYAKETISKQNTKISFLQAQLSRFKDLWQKVKKIFRIRVEYDKNEHFTKVAEEFYKEGLLNRDGTDVIKTEFPNKNKKNYNLY